MDREQAEIIALKAAAFIFSDDNAREGFMAQTGAIPEDIQAQLGHPETLAGLLEFLMGDEKRLLDFCELEELAPELPGRARFTLGGPANPEDQF